MEVVCIVTGMALVGAGIALFRLRQPNWKDEGDLVEHHRVVIERWSLVQRYVRSINNCLLILIGGLIVATAFINREVSGGGRMWGLTWIAIMVLLLGCILLAMIDALSSLAGYKRALPEAARRSFSDPSKKDTPPSQSQFPEELPD